MNDIKTININRKNLFASDKPTLLGRFLPIMLIVSFVFANFYIATQTMTPEILSIYSSSYTLFFILYITFLAVLDYAILLLVLWLYRTVMSYRPYFYLVKVQTFNEHFKFWYFVKNVLYGAICCILFVCPYLHMYFPIINLLLTFMVIVLTYTSLQKHIDIMFRHMYFKLLMYPFFIFEAINIILTIITGGY